MDQLIEASLRIIEHQGIVAFLLILQMLYNSRERAALLNKNCELNHFIMQCLQRELDEDHKAQELIQPSPSHSNGHDLIAGVESSCP